VSDVTLKLAISRVDRQSRMGLVTSLLDNNYSRESNVQFHSKSGSAVGHCVKMISQSVSFSRSG